MKTVLYAFKVKPGKLQDYLDFMQDCYAGEKQAQYRELLQRYGLHSVKIWHHEINGQDYIIFYHDMDDDGEEKLQQWNQLGFEFDVIFEDVLERCYEDRAGAQPKFIGEFVV